MRLSWFHIALCISLAALPLGCQNGQNVSTPSNGSTAPNGAGGTAAAPSPFGGAQMGGAPMSGAPMMAGGAARSKLSLTAALTEAPKLDPSLVPQEKQYSAAAAALKKKPNDPTVKKTYVDAAYNYGHAIEYSNTLNDPPVKYRASLLLYNHALAVDPNHQQSLTEKKQIESIYRSMGMEVPH